MELYWNRNVDPSRSPCLKTVDRKCFECRNFLVLRPVLLKTAYFNSANWYLSKQIPPMELRFRKIVDPSRGASYSSVERIFSVSRQKIKKAVIYLSFGQSCWNCTFKRLRSRAFQRCVACWIPTRKSCSSHLLGGFPAGLLRQHSCRNYQKP